MNIRCNIKYKFSEYIDMQKIVPGLIKNKNEQIFAFFKELVNLYIILNNSRQFAKQNVFDVINPLSIYGL
jgi:hypothetical protein